MASFFESSAHYYLVDGANITAAYEAGIKEARERKLYVSPTTVAYVRANPGLDIWKQSLLVKTVMQNPQFADETEESYVKRVKELARKPGGDAADFGTRIHSVIENYPVPPSDMELLPWFDEYAKWHEANVAETLENEIMLAHHGIGVAGRTDKIARMKDSRIAVLDAKSQGIKPGRKPNMYSSWSWQLAFYGRAYQLRDSLPEMPRLINLVIDSAKPAPPIAKEWTPEEVLQGWREFILHAWLWESEKNHWPAGRWNPSDFWELT